MRTCDHVPLEIESALASEPRQKQAQIKGHFCRVRWGVIDAEHIRIISGER